MPPNRIEWIERIKGVEREYFAVRLGVVRLLIDSRSDPAILAGSALRPRDVEFAADRSEGTYLIRIFAEFETGLRLFWTAARGTDPPVRTRDQPLAHVLVSSIALNPERELFSGQFPVPRHAACSVSRHHDAAFAPPVSGSYRAKRPGR